MYKITYISLLQLITLYQGRSNIVLLDIIAFSDTHVCINNLRQQSSGIGIVIILCKY